MKKVILEMEVTETAGGEYVKMYKVHYKCKYYSIDQYFLNLEEAHNYMCGREESETYELTEELLWLK